MRLMCVIISSILSILHVGWCELWFNERWDDSFVALPFLQILSFLAVPLFFYLFFSNFLVSFLFFALFVLFSSLVQVLFSLSQIYLLYSLSFLSFLSFSCFLSLSYFSLEFPLNLSFSHLSIHNLLFFTHLITILQILTNFPRILTPPIMNYIKKLRKSFRKLSITTFTKHSITNLKKIPRKTLDNKFFNRAKRKDEFLGFPLETFPFKKFYAKFTTYLSWVGDGANIKPHLFWPNPEKVKMHFESIAQKIQYNFNSVLKSIY